MDLPAPVASGIKVPDPMQSLNMMGGMMDLAKSRLSLQQGQQTLAQQKIETQKQQQAQGFLKDWDPSEHIGDDGTIDLGQAMGSDAFKKLDIAKPSVIDMLQRIKGGQLQQKQQLATLDGTTLAQLGAGVSGLANDPDVVNDTGAGRGKVADFFTNFSAQSPQNARIAKLYGGMVQNAPQGKLVHGVQALGAQAQDVATTRAQAEPVPTNLPNGMLGLRDRVSGKIWLPGQNRYATDQESAGAADQQPPPKAPAAAPPQTPTAPTKPPKPAGGAGWNVPTDVMYRRTAEAGQASGQDVTAYGAIRDDGTTAASIRGISNQVVNLARTVNTGKLTSAEATFWQTAAGQVGMQKADISDPGARRQILDKYAAQLKSQVLGTAHSPEARAAIEESFPDVAGKGPGAVIAAAHYIDGIAAMKSARLQNAENFKATHGGSTVGLTSSDSGLMLHADPIAFRIAELPKGAERQKLLAEYFKLPDGSVDKAGALRAIGHANAITSMVGPQ